MMHPDRETKFAPGKLWSLWDMIEAEINHLLNDHALVSSMYSQPPSQQMAFADKPTFQWIIERLERYAKSLETVGLAVSSAHAHRLVECLRSAEEVDGSGLVVPQIQSAHARGALQSLCEGVGIEAGLVKFLRIETPLVRLFEQKNPPFDGVDLSKFGGAEAEVSEAGKCIALKRNKAAVFHLMLAMEEAIRVLAAKGATTHDSQGRWLTWLTLARNIDAEIIAKMQSGPDKTAWQEASAMLKSVGYAWRNPNAHPGASYSEAEVMDIFHAVKGFMSVLDDLI